MRYLVAHEGSWTWNQETTYWQSINADSHEEAAAYHIARFLSHSQVQDPTNTVQLPEPRVLDVDDPLCDLNPDGDIGSYLVKLEGQTDSEAVAVQVNLTLTLCARLTPRQPPMRRS